MRQFFTAPFAAKPWMVLGLIAVLGGCAATGPGQGTAPAYERAKLAGDFELSCDEIQIERLKHEARIGRIQREQDGSFNQIIGSVGMAMSVMTGTFPLFILTQALLDEQEPAPIAVRRDRIAWLANLEDGWACPPMTQELVNVALDQEESEFLRRPVTRRSKPTVVANNEETSPAPERPGYVHVDDI